MLLMLKHKVDLMYIVHFEELHKSRLINGTG